MKSYLRQSAFLLSLLIIFTACYDEEQPAPVNNNTTNNYTTNVLDPAPTLSIDHEYGPQGRIYFNANLDTTVNLTWDFGDGFTSNETAPVHYYAVGKDYTVRLTLTDSLGTRTYKKVIDVSNALDVPYITSIRIDSVLMIKPTTGMTWDNVPNTFYRNPDLTINLVNNNGDSLENFFYITSNFVPTAQSPIFRNFFDCSNCFDKYRKIPSVSSRYYISFTDRDRGGNSDDSGPDEFMGQLEIPIASYINSGTAPGTYPETVTLAQNGFRATLEIEWRTN